MQTTYTITFAVIASLSGGVIMAQDNFNLNDLAPTEVDVKRSTNSQPLQPPPLAPQKFSAQNVADSSVFQNGLRGGETKPAIPSQRSRSSEQPLPPQPLNSTPAKTNQQNPMQELSPSRLPGHGVTPNPPNSRTGNLGSASTIPSSTPSSRRSVLAPTSDQDGSQVVMAAGLENQSGNRRHSSNPAVTTRTGFDNKNVINSLIARYSISNAREPLPGVPISLEEMLQTTDSKARLRMVQQYWETYFDWATLQNRKSYENWLTGLQPSRSQTDQLLLSTAKSIANNETLAAEIQLSRSQSKLQEIARKNPNEMLPLPLNDPVTSKYITHYEWYATRRMVPPKLKGINEVLPRTYQLLIQRAQTVGQVEQARKIAQTSYSSGQANMASVLEAGRSWQSAMQSMVATLISYNKAISDYALTVTPPQKPVQEIAAMLVSKPKVISAANLGQPARASVAQNPYAQPRGSKEVNAVGPNAGPFRQSANNRPSVVAPKNATFNGGQPNAAGQQRNLGQPATTRKSANQVPGFRSPGQNDSSRSSQPAGGQSSQSAFQSSAQPSQPFGGQPSQAAPSVRPQNNPAQNQPPNSNNMFGGGGAFGG